MAGGRRPGARRDEGQDSGTVGSLRQHPGSGKAKDTGLEAGEPVVCLPSDGGSLERGREGLKGSPHSGGTAHFTAFLQPVICLPPL